MAEYYNQKQLRTMGWSKKMIETLLPAPILKRCNHLYPYKVMNLYKKDVVNRIMKTMQFFEAKQKYEKKKLAGLKGYETEKRELMEKMYNFAETSTITILSNKELLERIYGKQSTQESVQKVNPEQIVLYICEHLTMYNTGYQMMKGKRGKNAVLPVYHNILYRRIAETYPEYAEICKHMMLSSEETDEVN